MDDRPGCGILRTRAVNAEICNFADRLRHRRIPEEIAGDLDVPRISKELPQTGPINNRN